MLSQVVDNPQQNHKEEAFRFMGYLKSIRGEGILLPKKGGTNLVAYRFSNWLRCLDTGRSRTSFLLLLGGATVYWKSKKKSVVSRFSAEVEYRGMETKAS